MGQRLVIDSNMLQSQVLRGFLMDDPDNIAVLPEFLWFEIYKQQSLAGLAAGLSVIGDFPDQTLMLRPWHETAVLDQRTPDIVARMALGSGHRLRNVTEALSLAERGEPDIMAQLVERWSHAAAQANDMIEGAEDIALSLPEIAEIFTAAETQVCRTDRRYTMEMFEKIFGAADQLYETFAEGRAVVIHPVSSEHRYESYLYRLGLAIIVYSLWWMRNGSQMPKRLDRVRNDIIDLNFGIHGTYFDGFMTEDSKAGWMFHQLRGGLGMARALAARV